MTLRRLVPHWIVQNYEAGRFHGHFDAVAMFIDVSGFSSLSDVLIQYGREGIEVLTDVINHIFDPIIAEVYARGGFVSTFAGDAFTALFPINTDDTVPQAVVAAFNIQDIMSQRGRLFTRLGTFSLAVKVGLDVGRVEWGILGHDHTRTFYFRGPAVDGSAHAEARARAGHIMASARLWPLISTHVRGKAVEDTHRLLEHAYDLPPKAGELPPLRKEQLPPFVPESILHLTLPAEFRNVCSVFISFQEPDTPSALDDFVSQVMALSEIYGGYFNKVDFGDKGNVILVLFGAPIAHENNVERAVEFLLALRERAPRPPWRAGMTFGTAYTGFVGGRARCEYTAIGDVVNLSSRLMTSAGWGQVLTDARVYREAKSRYTFATLGRRHVKGKRRAILMYRLLGRRAGLTPSAEPSPFVGRDKELQRLEEALHPLWEQEKGSRYILVYGEAGIGKTRLLAELRSRLSAEHTFFWLHCPVDDILRSSLNPFVHALRHYFHQSPDHSPEENWTAFERALRNLLRSLPRDETGQNIAAELKRTASMLAALVGLHREDTLYEQLEPELRFENTLLALINFFKALSLLRPLIVEVDGGHHLDRDSLTLLERMTTELTSWPVAVLVSARTDARGANLPAASSNLWTEIRLLPFSKEETQTLAESLLGRPLTEEAGRFLYETSGGNPLFLEQLIQYLRERGAFVLADELPDALTLAKPHLGDVPTTVDAVLSSRLDQLPPPVREVVQTASVLGQEFEYPVLAHMVERPSALPSLVRAAETERIWRPLDEVHYVFLQPMLRNVAYHMQMRDRLRRLHRRAGAAIEAVHKEDLTPYYADLAYHFEQGEDAEKARFYLRKAADQARLNYQNEQALALYERLLTYADEEERVRIHEYRGDIHHSMGSYAQALEAYSSALEIWLRHKGNERRVADIYRKIASIHVDKGEYNVALDWLDRAQQRLQGEDSPELARVLLLAAGIAYRRGQIHEALEQCQTARDIAERIGALPEQAHAYRLLGTIHTGAGDLRTAVKDYEISLELCKRLGDLRQESMASNSLAAVYYYLGDLNRAERMYLHSLEIATRIGFVDQQATVANNLGELYLLQGRLDEAETQFRRCLRTWQRTGFLLGVALSWRNLAQVAVNRGDWQSADRALQESLRVLEQLDSRGWLLADVYRLLAEVRLAQGKRDAAWRYCRQAQSIATEQSIKLVEANVNRTLGLLYRTEGRWEEAEEALRRSIALAQELGMRYEEALGWQELARLYESWPERSAEAQASRNRAHAILAAMGIHR